MRSSYRYIYTSWARWGAEIAVVRLCPAQLYVVGCNFLTRCFPCTNQQMESLPLWFFPFVREIWRIQSSEKNTKGTISWLKKNETAVAVFPRLCACAVQTRIQSFRSKLANIERGIAVLPLVVIITRSRGAFLSLYFRWLFEYNIIFFKNVLSRSNTISSIYILAVGNTPYGKLHISRTKLWKSSGVYCSPEESFHSRQYFW